MSGIVYRVPSLRISDIRDKANQLREMLGLSGEPQFPIMDVLELILDNKLDVLRLEIWEDKHLQGAEGLTFKDDEGVDRIVLPESVYSKALDGDGRSRFTAAHELGHWVLHSRCVLTRVSEKDLRGAFENSEWQANCFAAEILMPTDFVYADDGTFDLVERFAVSNAAAENRLRSLRKRNVNLKRKPPRVRGGF